MKTSENNFRQKKCEKSATDIRKEKASERIFLIISFLPIKTRFLYLFLQLSKF